MAALPSSPWRPDAGRRGPKFASPSSRAWEGIDTESSLPSVRLAMTLLLNIDVPDVEAGVRFCTAAPRSDGRPALRRRFCRASGMAHDGLPPDEGRTVGAGGDLAAL